MRYLNKEGLRLSAKSVFFVPIRSSADASRDLKVSWRGYVGIEGEDTALEISYGRFPSPFMTLRFEQDAIRSMPAPATFEVLAPTDDLRKHEPELRVDRDDGTFMLELTNDDRTLRIGPRAVNSGSAVERIRLPRVFMRFNEASTGLGEYVIDNILVLELAPPS